MCKGESESKVTWGRHWSEPFSRAVDLLKKTCISLFSVPVVRSRVVRESALLSHRAREKVKATIGSLSFFCSMCTRDNHTFFSYEEGNLVYSCISFVNLSIELISFY